MVKHLYFNPKNFHELILSGVLIEMLKNDIEVHSHEDGELLKFVQGQNVVENSIEAILLFASDIAKYKIFGANSQQAATITMINGVCKDIEKKLLTAESSQELIQKIEHLNVFWSKKSNSWLRKRFFYCHMNLLILSFKLQEKFPEILSKYAVFVELRKLFIEEKLMSKQSLIAMFAHPENKYLQFDLFPELEIQSHQIPSVTDEMIQKVATEQTQMQKLLQNNDENTHHELQKANQISIENKNSHIERLEEGTNKINAEQKHENHIHKHDETHQTESSQYQNEYSSQIQPQVKIQNRADHANHILTAQREVSIVEPQNIAISKIRQPSQSGIVSTMPSEIYSTLEQTVTTSEIQDKTQSHQLQNSESNQAFTKMKKSLKQSFSEHFTKPLEYSIKSVIEEEKTEHIHGGAEIPDAIHQENKNKKGQNHQVSKQQKSSNQTNLHQKKQETAGVKLNPQLIIDEAESQQYVSHQHNDPTQQKISQQEKPEQKQKESSSADQHKLQNKVPQTESNASWQKGPSSTMNKDKIKPKQQAVNMQKETCKCEIF